jgi:hypothetical protein
MVRDHVERAARRAELAVTGVHRLRGTASARIWRCVERPPEPSMNWPGIKT